MFFVVVDVVVGATAATVIVIVRYMCDLNSIF